MLVSLQGLHCHVIFKMLVGRFVCNFCRYYLCFGAHTQYIFCGVAISSIVPKDSYLPVVATAAALYSELTRKVLKCGWVKFGCDFSQNCGCGDSSAIS
jgi:hypothetical protein